MVLFDHPGISLKEALTNNPIKSAFKILKGAAVTAIHPTPSLKIAAGIIETLWLAKGICKGEKARELMEEFISKKTGIKFMTFGELRGEIQKGNNKYKHLHVFATKLGPNKEILDINSEDPKWDDVIISDAIRGSMAIPFVFEPHRLHIKKIGPNNIIERLPHPENYLLADGGMLYNLAIERFDRKRYFTQNHIEADKDFPVFNSRVLGLSLYNPTEEMHVSDREPKSIFDFLNNIISLYFQAEELTRNINPHNNTRVIKANSLDISTTDFGVSEETKNLMLESGEKAIEADLYCKSNKFKLLETIEASPKTQRAVKPIPGIKEVKLSQLPARMIGLASGLFALGICENLACRALTPPTIT